MARRYVDQATAVASQDIKNHGTVFVSDREKIEAELLIGDNPAGKIVFFTTNPERATIDMESMTVTFPITGEKVSD